MAHPEFTLLGDAVWLDFVNSARGRTTSPPDLLPDASAFTRWAHAQRLIDLNGGAPHTAVLELRRQLTGLAEALDAGRQAPAGAIAAINHVLAGSTGSQQLTRVSGEWRLQFAPAQPLAPLEAIARSGRAHPGRSEDDSSAAAPARPAPCSSPIPRPTAAAAGAPPRARNQRIDRRRGVRR